MMTTSNAGMPPAPASPNQCFGAFGRRCKAVATTSITKHKRRRWLCGACFDLSYAAAACETEVAWLNGTIDYNSSSDDGSDTEYDDESDAEHAEIAYCPDPRCAGLAPCSLH